MTCVIRNLAFVCLEIVLVSVQDMCTVEAQVEARFGLFGDSVNFDAR